MEFWASQSVHSGVHHEKQANKQINKQQNPTFLHFAKLVFKHTYLQSLNKYIPFMYSMLYIVCLF